MALIPLFLTSGDVSPGFQSQGGSHILYTSLNAYSQFIRFISGVSPADLLMASMAVEPFYFGGKEGVSPYTTVLYDDFDVVVVIVWIAREQTDGAEADEATHDVPLP